MKHHGSISSCLIIPVCIGLGVIVALVFSWNQTLLYQEPPMRLPSLPVEADVIVGIATLSFFSADPVVRAVDGKLYEYDQYNKQYLLLDSLPEYTQDTSCQQRYIERIEKTAGKVVSCREVQPLGEWCPAPYTVFALTSEGELWVFREQLSCGFFTIGLTITFAFAGLGLGLVIVLVRKIRTRVRVAR